MDLVPEPRVYMVILRRGFVINCTRQLFPPLILPTSQGLLDLKFQATVLLIPPAPGSLRVILSKWVEMWNMLFPEHKEIYVVLCFLLSGERYNHQR